MVNAVEVRGLEKRFGETAALRGVAFEVRRGEVFGFLGLNGAGKTTTLRILATLLDADMGLALVEGFDVAREPEAVRRRIGYVPAEMPPYEPSWSAVRHARFFGRVQGMPAREVERRARELARRLLFEEHAEKPLGALSSGNRRKAELMRALLPDPDVLLLDEPTRELDVAARAAVWDALREHAARGKAVVLSTHDVEEVREACDRAVALRRGRVAWSGTARELLSGGVGETTRLTRLLSGPAFEVVAPER